VRAYVMRSTSFVPEKIFWTTCTSHSYIFQEQCVIAKVFKCILVIKVTKRSRIKIGGKSFGCRESNFKSICTRRLSERISNEMRFASIVSAACASFKTSRVAEQM
jgi:hypothetical protein